MSETEFLLPHAPGPHEQWTEERLRAMIEFGIAKHMSDIKIIPGVPPYIRVYGRWHAITRHAMRESDIERIIGWISGNEGLPSRIKGGSFADFAYDLRSDTSRGTRRRFRCNATACISEAAQTGISLVMRRIPDQIPTLAEVDLLEKNKSTGEEEIGYIINNMFPQQGIVLFTGPTGSGKTTTLAAGIGYLLITKPELSVETYEDPIEFDYTMAGGKGPLIQISMAEHLQGNFENIAPNAARRSSDVVIVGESRDRKSFKGLIQLADMGMLTISTLHTRSVAETPFRILNTFDAGERSEIKASLIHGLRFVVQQRLLPTKDGKRVAIREWLAFDEKLRYELSSMDIESMVHRIRKEVESKGQLLIEDALVKYKAGIIDRKTFKVLEDENKDMMDIARGNHVA